MANFETKLADIPQECQDALKAFKAAHGRKWKDALYQAWANDTREQWGPLRVVRNNWPQVVKEV